jgi:DNA-binding GntR family transcriptional regulator
MAVFADEKADKKLTLSEKAYFILKNRILRGELRAGESLPEGLLSETLKVSRTPLRRALTRLMAEGYLVKGKDRTLRVPEISADEISETMEARRVLETAAVYRAAEHACKEEIDKIEHFIWNSKEALRTHDILMAGYFDRMFHKQISEASGNRVYAEVIPPLGCKTSLLLGLSETLGYAQKESIKEHTDILNYVKLKMPERASKAMAAHLDNVEKRILTHMEAYGKG